MLPLVVLRLIQPYLCNGDLLKPSEAPTPDWGHFAGVPHSGIFPVVTVVLESLERSNYRSTRSRTSPSTDVERGRLLHVGPLC
jgi:hypothetical protein